jgi:hypothetical protein
MSYPSYRTTPNGCKGSKMSNINQEALQVRANKLHEKKLNGLKFVVVKDLFPDSAVPSTLLELHFYTHWYLPEITDAFDPQDQIKRNIFSINGGKRIPAGWGAGQLHVANVQQTDSDTVLLLTVIPIGDYSTYRLTVSFQWTLEEEERDVIDPVFNTVDFKFRPACFNIDCTSKPAELPKPIDTPIIDYLAKDYDSFKHIMINAMMEKVPHWQPTSEADLDQVLIDLFSAAADELSDYQDRVMNEAYLSTARNRISIARHARLMDYHIHQGNQASTWLALELVDNESFELSDGFKVRKSRTNGYNSGNNTGSDSDDNRHLFISKNKRSLHYLLNRMELYTWSSSTPALAKDSTSADLKISQNGDKTDADTITDLIQSGKVTHLLIQENLNPASGRTSGVNPAKRQLLKLLPGPEGAQTRCDPLEESHYVRVNWEDSDKLKHNYCFTIDCPDGKKENISFFNGNLVQVFHGEPMETLFKEEGETLSNSTEKYYTRQENPQWGTLCLLPYAPLAYLDTPVGGDDAPLSTLEVQVRYDNEVKTWDEVIDLIHSGNVGEQGDHYMVETDESGRSFIRLGNGINGRTIPEGAEIHTRYQVGIPSDGNIGADTLTDFDIPGNKRGDGTKLTEVIKKSWNPFEITSGKEPEPVEHILRRVPEAYRSRQLRAVTLQDYQDRAEELREVAHASATYAWTGNWRIVEVTIDPKGTNTLSEHLKEKVNAHLEAVRLLGEDIEIKEPRSVPLEINVTLCADPRYWTEDIRFTLEQEFSEGMAPGGERGFFHPDQWTFGQSLNASQVIGRIQAVDGVDHVVNVEMKRWDNDKAVVSDEIVDIRSDEILQVRNDPDHREQGFITFHVKGGRQ